MLKVVYFANTKYALFCFYMIDNFQIKPCMKDLEEKTYFTTTKVFKRFKISHLENIFKTLKILYA